jgi:hypothetical protein
MSKLLRSNSDTNLFFKKEYVESIHSRVKSLKTMKKQNRNYFSSTNALGKRIIYL